MRADVRSWKGEGLRQLLFGAGSFGYSLLECSFCKFAVSSCLPLAGQTAHSRVPAGFRLCIHIMSMLKAVHSPRRAVDFVRISFEKLTTPRLKWLAALVKFQDGKEFEPKGNAFQVKGAFVQRRDLSFTQSLASVRFCVYEWFDVRSMTLRKSCAQKRVAFALLLDCTWYLSSLLAASGNKEQGGALHCFVQNRHLQPDGGELFRSNSPTWSSLCRVSA